MLSGVPVLAADNGGPTETVQDGVTGWLRDPNDTKEWTAVMEKVLHGLSEKELKQMSTAGVERVKKNFAVGQMAERLNGLFEEMDVELKAKPRKVRMDVVLLGVLGGAAGLVAAWVAAKLLMVLYGK